MQGVNVRNNLFSPNNFKCIEVNNFLPIERQIKLSNGVQKAQKTLNALERSLRKSSTYEQKLIQCKNTHTHLHDTHKWWDSDQSEQKSLKCRNTNANSSSSSVSGIGKADTWSTMSIICLQYQYDELSKRYEALLKAYDDQCSAVSARDMKLSQLRQRTKLTHAQLTHAHQALLTVGEMYLALKRKRNELRSRFEKRLNGVKEVLYDVVEMTSREQLLFDAKLSYCMSTERNSDAALLLSEIRKCNHLFLENMRLKTVLEELLPGRVNWKK